MGTGGSWAELRQALPEEGLARPPPLPPPAEHSGCWQVGGIRIGLFASQTCEELFLSLFASSLINGCSLPLRDTFLSCPYL